MPEKISTRVSRALPDTVRFALFRTYFRARDTVNRARYGSDAPTAAQRIWIDPNDVHYGYREAEGSPRRETGKVCDGDWDLNVVPIETLPKVKGVIQRIQTGRPWDQTAAWAETLRIFEERPGDLIDGIRTHKDIVERYNRLDSFIEEVKVSGRFKTREELFPGNFRESMGILVHVGRDGDLLFTARGNHRLGVARGLGLDVIPAQIGRVHKDAVSRRLWTKNLHPERAVRLHGAVGLEVRNPGPLVKMNRRLRRYARIVRDAVRGTKLSSDYRDRYSSSAAGSSEEFNRNRSLHEDAASVPKFERLIGRVPGRSFVEIGAAEGLLSMTLAEHMDRGRAVEITQIRHDESVKLREKWLAAGRKVENCEMVLGDAVADPTLLDDFDTVVASRVIYYFGDELDGFMRNVAERARYVCLIGNQMRSKLYYEGDPKELGSFARYTTADGMIELLEQYGFSITDVIRTGDPVVIAENSRTVTSD